MERKDRITFAGKPVTLIGPELKAGDKAPNFILVDTDLNELTLKDFQDKVKLISVAVSIDTSVCDAQLRKFNEQAASLGKDVVVLNVTMDLPFALKRFCGTAGIDRAKALSDYRYASFGENYGVLMKDLRLLARSVFVADVYNTLTYVEIVSEATYDVNFDNAIRAAKELISRGRAA
ncbi:MAG: lipid hydroperoxide peroxidase [Deltaproteobacteria bacterium GWA2_55_10]|nr:MAG: lipid hydroperoxide peroxidase [Deltaproteobacteria bacterium GWA2_55_10]